VALAAQNGSAAMLELLLKAGGKADTIKSGRRDAAHDCGAHRERPGHQGVGRARRAIDTREKVMGESALMWAAAENHAEAARVLLELGADGQRPVQDALVPRVQVGAVGHGAARRCRVAGGRR
jgi:ankyrin repeat protein